MNRVDPDGVRGKFEGERPHQTDESVLAGHVRFAARRPIGQALEARRGAGDDDRAATAPLLQGPLSHVGGVPHAGEVDADDVAPRERGVGDRCRRRSDARVGQHDVDTTQLLQAAVEGDRKSIQVTNVGLAGHDATALFLDQAHRLVEIGRTGEGVRDGVDVFAQVHGDDVHPVFSQGHGVRASLPPSRTSDERNFSLETFHGFSPPAGKFS